MIRDGDAEWVLDQLEQLALKLGIRVRYEALGDADDDMTLRGGSCRVKGNNAIIIDRYKSVKERCRLLASELKHLDLTKVYVPPAIRELLGDETGF